MTVTPLFSPPFRFLFDTENGSAEEAVGSRGADVSCLRLFRSCEITIELNSGETRQDVITDVDTDTLQIGAERIAFRDWSHWFAECRIGMMTGIEPDEVCIHITDASAYGLYPASIEQIKLDLSEAEQLNIWLTALGRGDSSTKEVDYPILYRKSPDGSVVLFGLGRPVPKLYYGVIERYLPEYGAGDIFSPQLKTLTGKDRIRFIDESFAETLTMRLDVLESRFDVSFTLGAWKKYSYQAERIYICRSIPQTPALAVSVSLDAAAEVLRRDGALTVLEELPPLSNEQAYGVIYFYKSYKSEPPQAARVGTLFRDTQHFPVFPEEELGSDAVDYLPTVDKTPLTDESGYPLNTAEFVYLISYVPGGKASQVTLHRTFSKRFLWMLRVEGHRLLIARDPEWSKQVNAHEVQPGKGDQVLPVEELLRTWGARARMIDLPKQAQGMKYGILFIYKSDFSFIQLTNAFINNKYSGTLSSISFFVPKNIRIPADRFHPVQIPNSEIKTEECIYLVAYSTDSNWPESKIVQAFSRTDVAAMFLLDQKALILATRPDIFEPDSDDNPQNESADDSCTEISLPPLESGKYRYAIVSIYARSFNNLYFFSAASALASKALRKSWVVAKANPYNLVVYDSEMGDPIPPDSAFNTQKNTYVVRIETDRDSFGDRIEDIHAPVLKICGYNRTRFHKMVIDGSTLRLYGYQNESFVQIGQVPEESSIPAYVAGETLLIADGSSIRMEVCPGASYQPEPETDVFRFGILTGLLKASAESPVSGGFLNETTFFRTSEMDRATKNSILTSSKRMLLLYTQTGGHLRVNRILLDYLQPVQWTEGSVKKCSSGAVENLILCEKTEHLDVPVRISHYYTTDTDHNINNRARNGHLNGETVYMKEIVCPGLPSEGGGLIRVAAFLHAQYEEAAIQYSEEKDTYYAYRYNPNTQVVGTNKVPVYGLEQALSSAVNQRMRIRFSPGQENPSELYAFLPEEPGHESGAFRRPDESSRGRASGEPQKPSLNYDGAMRTSMGRFLLAQAKRNGQYRLLASYLEGVLHRNEEQNPENEALLRNVVSSSQWLDESTTAALLLDPSVKAYFSQMYGVSNPNMHLRRAMRARIVEVLDSRNYKDADLMVNVLPLLETDKHWTQRYRDLYCYLLPCLSDLWRNQELIRSSIISRSEEADPADIRDQEYVKAIEDLLQEQKTVSTKKKLNQRATLLLTKLSRVDVSSLTQFWELFADVMPPILTSALDHALELSPAKGKTEPETSLLFQKLLDYRAQQTNRLETVCKDFRESMNRSGSVCIAISELNQHTEYPFFLQQLDGEDRGYLQELSRISDLIIKLRERTTQFGLQALDEVEQNIKAFCRRFFDHPSYGILQLLYKSDSDPLDELCREYVQAVESLYSDPTTLPDIQCRCEETILQPNQEAVSVLLSNGGKNEQFHRKVQNVVLRLNDSGGAEEQPIKPEPRVLASGSHVLVRVPLAKLPAQGEGILCRFTVEYQYPASLAYVEQTMTFRRLDKTAEKQVEFTLMKDPQPLNKEPMTNPYQNWKTSGASSKQYYGRVDEERIVLDYLMGKERVKLISGSTLVIYGQKRCGKSTFAKKIRDKISLLHDVVVLYYDDVFQKVCGSHPDQIPQFTEKFYAQLLKDLLPKLKEGGLYDDALLAPYRKRIAELDALAIPEADRISRIAEQFEKLMDELKERTDCRIVLILDEFTRLCMGMQNSHPEASSILSFIRYFSEKFGLVQIIVGHSSMMELFRDMNAINRVVSASKVFQLSSLDEPSAKKMIWEPLQGACGYDLFSTESGSFALDKLMDLSGGYPNYILFLGDVLFQYYQASPEKQIDELIIQRMLAWLNGVEGRRRISNYTESLFDPILKEDSDSKKRTDEILSYLYYLARTTYRRPNHVCSINEFYDGPSREDIRAVQKILIERDVLHSENGKLRIKVGLFREYVHTNR